MATDKIISYESITIFKMSTDLMKTKLQRFEESSRIFLNFVLRQPFLLLQVWFSNGSFLKNCPLLIAALVLWAKAILESFLNWLEKFILSKITQEYLNKLRGNFCKNYLPEKMKRTTRERSTNTIVSTEIAIPHDASTGNW